MPKLTGEELSQLYPKAKTCDELQAEREQIQEARRPRFVNVRIASWVTLIAVAMLGMYVAGLRLLPSFESGSMGNVMFGVCAALLLAVCGIATIYYLYSLIDDVASKVFLNTTPLYSTLILALCACGAMSGLLLSKEYSLLVVASLIVLLAFTLSLTTTIIFKRFST